MAAYDSGRPSSPAPQRPLRPCPWRRYVRAVYYTAPWDGLTATTVQPGFRMIVGNPIIRNESSVNQYRQLIFTCPNALDTRTGGTKSIPKLVYKD
uniref:Uncharacterized protein B23B10.230 n=1 Tax=Neurospora crassa TaxID=5141 RepID=Q872X5_NEUCS|nr:hypothetical protein [Neurospora crassa]